VVINSLPRLLEPCAQDDFFASFWGQTYKHVRGGSGRFAYLLSWERLNSVLRHHRLDFPRLRLVEEGKTLPPSSCLRYVAGRRGKPPVPRLMPVELARHLRRGATLVLDAVDELDAPLEELAVMLELFFRERVQINAYAGWQTSRGFDLHWDDHDVFILQVLGRKRWSIYGETRPHPVSGDGALCETPDHPPLWEETLEDGDLLYIPRGFWHVAAPLAEPTLHLTVGIHNRTGLDLLNWVNEKMRAREAFRKDLPRFAAEEERAAHVSRLREEFLNEWDDRALERFLEDFDAQAEPRAYAGLPWSATQDVLPDASGALVRLAAPRPLNLRVEDGIVEFTARKKRWRLAEGALVVLRPLEERRICTVAELCEAARGKLDERTVRAFLRELIVHGLVVIVDG
jgi:hypothetical protein